MTREEAVKWLSNLKKDIGKTQHQELWHYEQAIDKVIEALQQEPSCRNPRQVDLISKQDAVNEIHKYFVEEIDKTPTEIDESGDELYADMPTVNSLLACNKELSKRIKSLPSAEPKRGKWVDKGDFYICSECGERMTYAALGSKCSRAYAFMSDYCPHCGARMEEVSDEE